MLKLNIKAAVMAALVAAVGLSGCSSSKSADAAAATPSVTISGSMSAASLVNPFSTDSVNTLAENGSMTLTLGNLEIYVIYTLGTTVGIVQAAVNASTGAWSFNVPQGSQINALVRDKTSLELVGPITFVDATKKDMSGNSKESTTYSFKDAVSLGSIVLSSTGKFQVDTTAAAIAAASNTATVPTTAPLDFSGEWTAAAYTGTLPDSSYGTTCAQGATNCHGPTAGDAIYFLKIAGKEFSYTGGNCATFATNHTGSCAASAGTTSATDITAVSIWGGAAAVSACGFKTGFSADEARAFGHIDTTGYALANVVGVGVSSTPMNFGAITFTTPTGFGGDAQTGGDTTYLNNLPWMKTGALSTQAMPDCKPMTKTVSGVIYNLNVCKGTLSDSSIGYSAMIGGGCIDSAGKPVTVYNWGSTSMNCSGGTSNAFTPITGMNSWSCSYTGIAPAVASATAFTCSGVNGTFTDANATVVATGLNMTTFASVGGSGTCQAITDALARYRCYANNYFQNRPNLSATCGQEYRFNWNAATAATFVVTDNSHQRPKQNFLTNIITYSADGKSFSVEDESDDGIQVPNGNGSSLPCRIAHHTTIKGTFISANQILVDLEQSAYLRDTTIAACVGAKNDTTSNGGNGSDLYQRLKESGKSMFYLNK